MSTSWRYLAMSIATRVAGGGVGLISVMVGRPPACVERHHCETCWLAMTTPRSAAARPGPAPPRCFPMYYGVEFPAKAFQEGIAADLAYRVAGDSARHSPQSGPGAAPPWPG